MKMPFTRQKQLILTIYRQIVRLDPRENIFLYICFQDLCWVLEPERLCEAITGKDWSDVKKSIDGNPALKERFHRHEQLAR